MFSLAEIRSINEADNNVKIRDMFSGAVYDVGLDNHIHFQSMPLVKDIVLYYNLDDKIFKIVKIWQIADDPQKRKGEFLLKSGELQLQGLFGQYIYLDNKGTIKFVDSTMLNEFELTLEGFIATLKKWQLTTYEGVMVEINKDIKIYRSNGGERITKDEDGNIEQELSFEATIDDKGVTIKNPKVEITITPEGEIVMKGESILLGNQLYGDVITGGFNGTWPICPLTGSPITGSAKCKAEK